MTEIPSDVMKAAYDAALDYRHDKACDPIHNDDSLQIAFSRAILAERERCAKVAYAYADAHTSDHKMIGNIIGRKILFDTVDDGS